MQEAELAAIEAAEQEREALEEKKRREAEGIMDDEVEAVPNNNNLSNHDLQGYGGHPDQDAFYEDGGHQGQQPSRERMDRPPMR